MSGVSDEELRQHFQALRELELARVRPFAELSRRPAAELPTRQIYRARQVLVGGLGALAAAAMLAVHVERRREAAWLDAASAISRWQPPSDALLRVARAPLGSLPTLGASVLDSIIPPSRED